MKKAVLITSCVLAMLAWGGSASAAVLLQFNFSTATGLSASTVDANATPYAITHAAGYATLEQLSYPSPMLRVAPTGTSVATAVTNNSYFEFAVEPKQDFELDLATITFKAARGGAGTPRGWALRSSLDNYAANLGTSDIGSIRPNWTDYTVTLPASFLDLDEKVTFRMYVYSPGTGSTVEFDDVTINGAATLVPEPGLAGLAIIAVTGLLRRRRELPAR